MEENQDFIIEKEADAQEFKAILYEITAPTVTMEAIDEVLRAYPIALAKLLKAAARVPFDDGRAELYGGLIANLDKRDAAIGHGVADGIPIPEHYTLRLKGHKKFLDAFAEELGLEVKNG